MAKRKALPPKKGQKYGWQYVKQEMTRRSLSSTIEERKFSRSSAEQGDVTLTYDPTNTTWPSNGWDHRRTTAAGYNKNTGVLRIEFFTDGSLYDYGVTTPIPPEVARQFRRAASPGRFINSTLEGYGYERIR